MANILIKLKNGKYVTIGDYIGDIDSGIVTDYTLYNASAIKPQAIVKVGDGNFTIITDTSYDAKNVTELNLKYYKSPLSIPNAIKIKVKDYNSHERFVLLNEYLSDDILLTIDGGFKQ